MTEKKLTINGREISFDNEKNLLEVIRKANINIPTFCYHSELSTYGACRLCIVDIDGRGIVTSCSTTPQPGMNIKTHTEEVRGIRKIALELLLANHDQKCTTCSKSASCKLQELSENLKVEDIRFKQSENKIPLDDSSGALVRDPNKCILCGDCVRACYEIQGIGAIDFAYRGSEVTVTPAYKKGLSEVECVDCGQCARVCPTGAIIPKSYTNEVWKELDNPKKTVVAQIAPAVRVAIGEMFGIKPGTILTGQIVAALKMLGFDKVYDSSFAADLTVLEEANEFLKRKENGENLPQFTSCCPGWVKFAEQYHPEYLDNLSSCKSPQQMFGAVAKEYLPSQLEVDRKDLVMVSIMPCTAKKVEAARDEFENDGVKDVDIVITTQELASMIKQAGIKFEDLNPESLDLPLGFKTGAGVIFGNSGGVSEAVLRYVGEKLTNKKLNNYEFSEVRGEKGIRIAAVTIDGLTLNLAVVHGLANAEKLIQMIKNKKITVDLVEVMACPGGCIGGAGQPVCFEDDTRAKRTEGLYSADKTLQLHKSQENHFVNKLYEDHLGEIGGETAHKLLHTKYKNRKRIFESELSFISGSNSQKLEINVCVGTNCFVKGSQKLLQKTITYIEDNNLEDLIDVKATFCMEECNSGPNITIGDKIYSACTFEDIKGEIDKVLTITT